MMTSTYYRLRRLGHQRLRVAQQDILECTAAASPDPIEFIDQEQRPSR
jgi:hypothetical protein